MPSDIPHGHFAVHLSAPHGEESELLRAEGSWVKVKSVDEARQLALMADDVADGRLRHPGLLEQRRRGVAQAVERKRTYRALHRIAPPRIRVLRPRLHEPRLHEKLMELR